MRGLLFPSSCHGVPAVNDCAPSALAAWRPSSIFDCLRCAVPCKGWAIPPGNLTGVHHEPRIHHGRAAHRAAGQRPRIRSEEHTSELQSQSNLVCRLLLEKKKEKI